MNLSDIANSEYASPTRDRDDLPSEVLSVLPADPFEQLDLARKIIAVAFEKRLQTENGSLRAELSQREREVKDLKGKVRDLEVDLKSTNERLTVALEEQNSLTAERNALTATVKKLNRDVAKLETFKRALMQSLQDEPDENAPVDVSETESSTQSSRRISYSFSDATTPLSKNRITELDDPLTTVIKPVRTTSARVEPVSPEASPLRSASSSYPTPSVTRNHRSGSANPSPAGSPTRRRSSNTDSFPFLVPVTPSQSQPGSAANSPPHQQRGGQRVDGKDFFRQARNRLSYQSFSAFLTNIKELNAHRQSREETLSKANDIFGPENKDLYDAFDTLLTRHLPS